MSAQRRPPRRRVDGVLLLDKPAGITSNGALLRVKRSYNAEKAGHTGTLDPLASGLLPICFGEATKFAGFLLDAPKRYAATVRFGIATTTQDAEGEVVASRPVAIDRAKLLATLQRFVGPGVQTPPMHSALKHEGRPYYEYARKGIDVPRAAREVTIHALSLLDWKAPDAVLDVECSKGTYVRTLAADLGEALGCGAHLRALRRTRTGAFDLDDAVTLAAVESMDDAARVAALLPIDAPLAAMPRLDLEASAAIALAQGRNPAIAVDEGRYRIYGPNGCFVGAAQVSLGRLSAIRLVRAPDAGRACEAAVQPVTPAPETAIRNR
ncbi:MAG TPA: tRNA pseudouridine(55) synthase TruB [Casimicrobiaceae bacterium]